MVDEREENVRIRSREAAKQLRQYVEEAVGRGELKPGDKLPNERELATRFNTGRNTVRKALVALEKEGKIERAVGSGTFIKAQPANPTGFATQEGWLGRGAISRAASPFDLMEFRLALEPSVAAAAVERAGTADIDIMQALVDASRTAGSLGEFEDLDDQLHRTIACSCRNPLFLSAAELITAVRTQAEWGVLKRKTLTDEMRLHHTQEHQQIVDAIRRRDAKAARAAMAEHLTNVRRMMLGGIDDRE
ncbi:FadR family transcriptional regulator [Ensifer sp. ENS04]|uniref:FadR/GntR family transcriptional regulator n=1 Tax=Ensifer sp. ENS04 TaxID=2769281 RepID=UPI0017829F9E|nr:FCD domain-containing protein [Ensifer sp. ENS04]MBD9541436.1 FadR family transcriptional regulator [Ensifer sp. ENS04]